MSNYKDKYNKFDIVRELLAQRYMITSLMVNINNLCYYLELKEKELRELIPEDKRNKIRKTIKYNDAIQFNNFEISSRYYNALVNKFGSLNVSNATILLDEYLKRNIDKSFTQNTINKKLKEYATQLEHNTDVNTELDKAIREAVQVDYTLIDNVTLARQYIAGIPFYLRTVDKGCIYLKEKFNI